MSGSEDFRSTMSELTVRFLGEFIIEYEVRYVFLDRNSTGFYVFFNDGLAIFPNRVAYMSNIGDWHNEINRGKISFINITMFETEELAIEALYKYYNVLDLDLGVLE